MASRRIEDGVRRLEELKVSFRAGDGARTAKAIDRLARERLADAASLIRFHEALLFLCAYPHSAEVATKARKVLDGFRGRVEALRASGADLSEMEEPEVSGIAGTGLSAVFSYATARDLAARHGPALQIDWEGYEKGHHLGRALPRLVPLLEEEALVEAGPPYREWVRRAAGGEGNGLGWLLGRLASSGLSERVQAEIYDSLELMLRWEMKDSRAARTHTRLPARRPYCHREPLIRRKDIRLEQELGSPPLPVRRLSVKEGERLLEVMRDTSAARYRELHGFTFGDPRRVLRAEAGRGVEIYVTGVGPEQRLPLRAYHGAMFFKNGVPVGYVEGLSLFERMEVGFNIYYTFRQAESAWLYARTLRLMKQLTGVERFVVDPYQIGRENEEAIESGAFWFYRKLGFRPVGREQAALCAREEHKAAARDGYRTPAAVLRRLAQSAMIWEPPGCGGEWDRFQVRHLCLAVQGRMAERFGGDGERMRRQVRRQVAEALGVIPEQWGPAGQRAFDNLALVLSLIPDLEHWTEREKAAAVAVVRAKWGPDESRYLRLMQRHGRLRAAIIRIGSTG